MKVLTGNSGGIVWKNSRMAAQDRGPLIAFRGTLSKSRDIRGSYILKLYLSSVAGTGCL